MRVSVICTVLNEQDAVVRLLDSLVAQTRPPDEVVIVDGGSRDGTQAAVMGYAGRLPLKLQEARGANISRGRNLAIAAAAGPLIASTDAGVRLSPQWLEKLTAPWSAVPAQGNRTIGGIGDVTGAKATGGAGTDMRHDANAIPLAAAGFFVADAKGVFQTAMAATVLPLVDEIDPSRFLPSSRSVAFTKDAWAHAGGYPEWLDYCEDLLFDFAVNEQRPDQPTAFAWAPEAVVHFRPRTSLRQFWTQYYRYARGDGKADLWRKRHAVRYVTYFVLLPALLGHAFFGFFARWLGWLGLIAGIILYCRRPWQRLAVLGRDLSPGQWLSAAAFVPLIRIVGDLAKMAGYPPGVWWRLQRNRAGVPGAQVESERKNSP
jgi:glycosyltransferase involved in cell wall biosynthesis